MIFKKSLKSNQKTQQQVMKRGMEGRGRGEGGGKAEEGGQRRRRGRDRREAKGVYKARRRGQEVLAISTPPPHPFLQPVVCCPCLPTSTPRTYTPPDVRQPSSSVWRHLVICTALDAVTQQHHSHCLGHDDWSPPPSASGGGGGSCSVALGMTVRPS